MPSANAPTSGLAAAVAGTLSRPADVRDRVVDLVADCVAVAALGSARAELRRLVECTAWAPPRATRPSLGRARLARDDRQLLNGTAAAADQLQDGHRLARGHPASHVVPAVLALAEQAGTDGTRDTPAVLAGYEAGVRVGRAMGGTPPGVHDIGTWGPVAVAAAIARLLAPGDADAARRAVELAASAVLLTDATRSSTGTPVGTPSSARRCRSAPLGERGRGRAVRRPGALDRHLAAVAAQNWHPRH